MLTPEIMRQMGPHGDVKIPGLVDGIATAAPTVFPKYGLTNDLLIAHAMAQFSHECGAGTEVVENLNYSADGLMKTWPSRFNAVKAAAFAHHPEQIANEVYNGRAGLRRWLAISRTRRRPNDGARRLSERGGEDRHRCGRNPRSRQRSEPVS